MVLLEPLSHQPVSGGPVLFLAGPVTAAPRWQSEAFDLIQKLDPGMIVASPRRFHSVRHARYKATGSLNSFHCQRAWERHYMDLAALRGCVLFWLAAPRESVEGLPYGATTRYALGLWSSRWSRDPSLGLCVGGDPGFPAFGTLVYDLEMEMPGRKIHRDLEETVRESVGIARANYDRRIRAGDPTPALESTLVSMSHAERSLAETLMARLPGRSRNHPETLRRETLRFLRAIPDPGFPGAPPSEESEALEELEDAEELEELEAVEAPAAPSDPLCDPKVDGMRRGMRETGSWFLAGRRVEGPKYLAVGRGEFCLAFLQRLSTELGSPTYPSDYMEPMDPDDPLASRIFYFRTAERIDINLEGISTEALRAATVDACGGTEGRSEGPCDMVSWEIGRLWGTESEAVVFWHTGGSMDQDTAFSILGKRVPRERIVED